MADAFTADQLEEWKDYWELFDNEGEGKIYWNQVGSAIRSFGWCPTESQWKKTLNGAGEYDEPPSKEEMNRKQVSFDEFLPILKTVSEMKPTGTREDFIEGMKVFDKDGSGFVLAVEIQHVLATLGEKLTQEQVDEIFKDVMGEVNANGAIKFNILVDHIVADPEDEAK